MFCVEPYKSIYNHCDVIGLQSYRIRGLVTYYPLRVDL